MDNLPNQPIPNQPSAPIPQQSFFQSTAGKIAALVGIITILLITLVVLNYFKILPISQMFPQLSFLPKKQTPASSQVIPPTVKTFDYDTEKAKKLLSEYITSTIKPEILVLSPDVKQGFGIDGKKSALRHEFGVYLQANEATISANFHYIENTNTPNDMEIFIQPIDIKEKTVTSDLANKLVTTYFLAPYTPIKNCQTRGTASYCEEFKEEKDGKRGFGIIFNNQVSSTTRIIFTCFIPKKSNNYSTQASCIIRP